MGEVRAGARLRVNLMDPNEPAFRRRPDGFVARWTPHVVLLVVGAPAAVLLGVGLERLPPGVKMALFLVFQWLVALSYVGMLVSHWRERAEDSSIPMRWVVVFAVAATWFSVDAALETYAALT